MIGSSFASLVFIGFDSYLYTGRKTNYIPKVLLDNNEKQTCVFGGCYFSGILLLSSTVADNLMLDDRDEDRSLRFL